MRPPLMIFAAGLGTRMRPLTDHQPKPLIEVAGKTLLDRAIEMGQEVTDRIVVNSHYKAEQIAAHLAGRNITISDESELLLDTGGGLRKALPLLGDGPVLTLNPDVVWTGPNPLQKLCETWDDRMDALLTVIPLEQATARVDAGDFAMDDQNRLTRKGNYVYAGAQLCRPERLAEIPDDVFSLNQLWNLLISEGRAYGMIHHGGWCDVGRPEAIPLAEAVLADG